MAVPSNGAKKQRMGPPDVGHVLDKAREIMRRKSTRLASATEDRQFREFFGCGPAVTVKLWSLLMLHAMVPGSNVPHMLWALMFMKMYSKETTLCALAGGIDAKTLREWTWPLISAIASLAPYVVSTGAVINRFKLYINVLTLCLFLCGQIVWENRLKGDTGNDCMTSVDCTDFRIPQYGRDFYSYKFNKSGLRYEVALCIKTGDIVWVNGPFAPGLYNDWQIFQEALQSHLGECERVEADDGYVGGAPQHVKCPKSFANPKETEEMQKRVRARHETVNKRFKQWGILEQQFRNDLSKHSDVFHAIAVITQLSIENGEPLFSVDYND